MDISKRLIDYGFHPPTNYFPLIVPECLMIEPTESESKAELDRFCEALDSIHTEIAAIGDGRLDASDNALKHAPHTAETVVTSDWTHAYTREHAAFPLAWVKVTKYWPPVSRIDNVHGDRHLICSCISVEEAAA